MGRRNLKKSISKLDIVKLNRPQEIPAVLGVKIGGETRVEVPGREGYHYARFRDDLSELVQVFNDKTSPVYGLPVLVTRDEVDKSRWRVIGRDLGRYDNWSTSSPYLPKHGPQHSFDPSTPGADPVWVWGRQWMPLAATPSGSAGGPNVIIQGPTNYYQNKDWKCAGGTGTADITGLKPDDDTARMVLVYLDQYGNPQLLGGGTYFAANLTGTCQVTQYIPDLPDTAALPIAGVRLVSGSSIITWNQIYDLRPHLVGDGFIATGTSGHIIQDDGVDQDHRDRLNFIGFNVWNDADSTNVSGTASGHIILEDGTPLTQRPDLDFTNGLVAYDDAANAKTIVSGTVVTYPAYRIPYAGTDQYLTTWELFNLRTDKNPTLLYGGRGDSGVDDLGSYNPFWDDFGVAIIAEGDDSYQGGIGLFAYNYHPKLHAFAGLNAESAPEYIEANDLLFEQEIYGWATGTYGILDWGYSKFIEVGNLKWIAREDYDEAGARGAKLEIELGVTGSSSSRSDAFTLFDNQAFFFGDMHIPTGSSRHTSDPAYYHGHSDANLQYPEGTWRTVRQGDDLHHQRRESSSWVNKAIIGKDTTKVGGDIDGGNYSEFESDGSYQAIGDATVYDDQQVNLGVVGFGASAPDWEDYKGTKILAFDKGQDNKIVFTTQLSHKYMLGSEVEFHIHDTVPDNATGTARWIFTYSWADINGVFPSENSIVSNQFFDPNSLDKHLYFGFNALSGTSSGVSSIILCSLMREGTHGDDDYDNDVYLLALDFHIKCDTLGSRSETEK